MRNRTLLVSSLLAGATLVAGCGSQSLSSTGSTEAPPATVDLSTVSFERHTGTPTVEVDAVDNTFKAQYIEVSAGTAVTFRNDGHNEHNVIPVEADSFASIPTTDFQPGTEKTITFSTAGDYPYYCTLHGSKTKGMIGAVRVQ